MKITSIRKSRGEIVGTDTFDLNDALEQFDGEEVTISITRKEEVEPVESEGL